jgi:PKD repeat protein
MQLRRSAARAALAAVVTILGIATCRDSKDPVAPPAATKLPPPALAPTADVAPSDAGAPAVLVGAGDIAACTKTTDNATANLLDGIAGEVCTLGDNAYDKGTDVEYANCYAPTWGRHKARTHPAAGDRDYSVANAPAYFAYFGAAAGDPTKGYYSYDAGDWHVVVLNSKLSMSASSAQITWLKADLAASSKACTIAYWHKPRFWTNGSSSTYTPAWEVLYKAGAEVVMNAERRNYERFKPQDPAGVADPSYGIREFIVGTGGAATTSFGTPHVNSEARIANTAGVLKLTLHTDSYEWQFVPIAGLAATDQGSGTCHGAPPPVARISGSYRSEATLAFDGSTSSDPQGDLPLTYAWDFGDPADPGVGSGPKPTHVYGTDGTYTVTLVVTDSKGNKSAPVSTTAVIENMMPIVTAGQHVVTTGMPLTYSASFTDGERSSPWSFLISWGDGSADATGTTSTTGKITAPHTYTVPGDYVATLTLSDVRGGSTTAASVVYVRDPGASMSILVAGDITSCDTEDEATAKLLDAEVTLDPTVTIFTLGDNAYPSGRAQDYTNCYQPTWGRHKARTWVNLGNHEYDSGTANPTFDYFGERAGARGKGYYSLNLGDWHIIVLNDNYSKVPMAAGSEQDKWLVADLAANTKRCTMAIFHQPRFYSSSNSTTIRSQWKILWDRLWPAGVDVILNGHQHIYERFAPMRPDGSRDDLTGIKQFIAGTGGEGGGLPSTRAANSEVLVRTLGILKLVLRQDSYDWQFKPIAGQTFTDSGSAACH